MKLLTNNSLQIHNKIILLFVCFAAYSITQSFDLSNLSLSNNNSTPIHNCDTSTHTHETYVIHHTNYDKYVESCINIETRDYILNENIIYHTEANTSDLDSSPHNINNATHSYDDYSNDLAIETRRQEIEENKVAQIESYNKPFTTSEKIIYELTIPKGTILYLRDIEGRTFDSTLILNKIHTIKELITALHSPIIKARFERIKVNYLRSNNPKKGRDHRAKNEITLLNLLISREITRILSRIMHPKLNVAQSAFDKLQQLWPWKREHTFLGPNLKYGTGETYFTTMLGIDIMKMVETSLITRPDYIAKHANAQEQKIILEYREKCYQLQQEGNHNALFNQKQQLYRCIIANKNKNDLVTNVCFAITEKLFADPITTAFCSIINEPSLEKACDHLKNMEQHIITQVAQHNIISMSEIRTWVIDHYGFDVLEFAHKTYKDRLDHKKLAESFIAIDVNQAAIEIIETNTAYDAVANEMNDLAQHVFANAHYCNLNNLLNIESHVYDSIDAMKKAQNHPTFIFNFSIVNHTLGDIQQIAQAILSGKHPTLERSSELLIRGFGTFFKGLNPLAQASSMGHLACDLGSLLKKVGSALWNDPITVIHDGITSTFTLTELIRNTADFTSDLTIGKLYLSPEEYKQRTDAFCAMIKPLQGITAEHCVDFVAQLTADALFFKGIGNAYRFLKEIDVLEKLSESAAAVACIFKKGFDTHLANNPIIVTAEGITIKISDDLKNVGEKLKNSSLGQKVILHANNMKEFFELSFGKTLIDNSQKTAQRFQHSPIYKITKDIPGTDLKKGYFYYLDRFHNDHIEVFDHTYKCINVYNLDGTTNTTKYLMAKQNGRNIKSIIKGK